MNINIGLQQFISECREGIETHREETTLKGYELALKVFVRTTGVDTSYDIDISVIRYFIRWGETERNWKASSVHTYCKRLSPYFDWLVKNQHLSKNPLKDFHKPPILREAPKYYTDHQIQDILHAIEMEFSGDFVVSRTKAMFAVLALAGLRRNEMLQLKVGDIDFINETIIVRAETAKNRCPRQVKMSPKLQEMIKGYLILKQDRYPQSSSIWVSHVTGRPLTIDGLKHIINRISARLGYRFTPQKLRSTFAINGYKGGKDVLAIKQALGHRDINTTMIYTQALDEGMRKMVNMNPLNHLF